MWSSLVNTAANNTQLKFVDVLSCSPDGAQPASCCQSNTDSPTQPAETKQSISDISTNILFVFLFHNKNSHTFKNHNNIFDCKKRCPHLSCLYNLYVFRLWEETEPPGEKNKSNYPFSVFLAPTSAQLNPPIQRRRDAQQKPLLPPPPPLVLVRLRTLALQHRLARQMQGPPGNQTLPPLPPYLKRLLQRLLANLGSQNPHPFPQTPSLPHRMRQRELKLLLNLD